MAASQVVAVTLRGVVCGVRCVPGQFDSRLRAYLDRWILELSFAVGRWHFSVVRHATRCARVWLAWWWAAAIGRVRVEMGPEGRIRRRTASSNQKTKGAEGVLESVGIMEETGRPRIKRQKGGKSRASNDGGRGEATDGFMSSSVCAGLGWWEKTGVSGGRDRPSSPYRPIRPFRESLAEHVGVGGVSVVLRY
jgi:hypothetical protein